MFFVRVLFWLKKFEDKEKTAVAKRLPFNVLLLMLVIALVPVLVAMRVNLNTK